MAVATPSSLCARSNVEPWFVHRGGITSDAAPYWMSDVLDLLGADVEDWSRSCALRQIRVRAGNSIFSEGAVTRALFVVRFGCFKCFKIAEDGYEQVVSFTVSPGDVIGFEGLANSGCQPLGATALDDAGVLVLPLDHIDSWRRQSPVLDRALQYEMTAQLIRAQQANAIVAAVASDVRLARFLVWMSERMVAAGLSPRRILLRMSRRDIASFLAVAHETVSRGFGALSALGYVKVENRHVEILDMAGLVSRTVSTRRSTDQLHSRAAASRVTTPGSIGSVEMHSGDQNAVASGARLAR